MWCDTRHSIKKEGMINSGAGKLMEVVVLELGFKRMYRKEMHIDLYFQQCVWSHVNVHPLNVILKLSVFSI